MTYRSRSKRPSRGWQGSSRPRRSRRDRSRMGRDRGEQLMLAHLALALAIQLLVVAVTRSWWGGAIAGAGWAISREITQAEYRWIERFGGGLRANMPWWGGFDLRVWQRVDPWLDWIVPLVVTFAVAIAVRAADRYKLGPRSRDFKSS